MSFDNGNRQEMIDLEWDDRNIHDYFEKREFFFPKEIITRYFLSLKTKPFVILTGISGTGKTKIAQIFADYVCQDDTPEDREKRMAFISVRPDWMDNKGLLGYYNLLDEKYHATPLLKLLLEAGKNPSKPYFVILDEMNLAKVEQYFSDFLSIMESRTSNNPAGEPIELCSAVDPRSQEGTPIPAKTHIPPNVYFTGTVNVDESTYMFSPKVLDRANVIEFNEVDLENYAKGFDESEEFILENHDIRTSLSIQDSPPFCSRTDYATAMEIMNKKGIGFQGILDILRPYNLHFGYRVVNEVSRFIVNANVLIKDFNIQDTLDIQLLQKILPKFHGSQARIYEPLARLLGFCYSDGTSLTEIPPQEEIEKDVQNGAVRFPRSARKLARMLWNLKVQGYTSFID